MSTTTSPAKGKLGQALTFDGVDDKVSVADSTSLDITSAITMSAWVKFDSGADDGDSIISKDHTSCVEPYRMYSINLWISGGVKKIRTEIAIGGLDKNLATLTALSADRWYHVAMTYDGSNIRLYLDGTLDNSSAQTGSIDTSNQPVLIGKHEVGDCTGVWDGLLDDVRVYNRALSADEVRQLYQLGQVKANASENSRLTGGLVGLWSFNGADVNWSANKALDRSGSGNDGVLTSMSTTTSPAKGKLGQALTFDATNDYVSILSSSHLVTTNDWTFSAWVNVTALPTADAYDTIFLNGDDISGGGVSGFIVHINYPASVYRVTIVTGAETETNVPSLTAASTGSWKLLTFTKEGTSAKVYLNGVLDNTVVLPSATMDYTANAPMTLIGIRSDLAPTSVFDGKLDEVRIYNRALSADEVLQLYNMGK